MTAIKVSEEYTKYQQYVISSIHRWNSEASCKRLPQNVDFFDVRESNLISYSKKYCTKCPVQYHCLYTAMISQEIYGLWGGLTPKQRHTYISYILNRAREDGLDTKFWSKDLDAYFRKYSSIQGIKEVFPILFKEDS